MILLKSFSVNRIWKVVIAIMASLSALSFISCTNLNKTIADEVCAELRNRYGIEFVADKIGDRLNTDSATLILHPVDNPDLHLVAIIDRNTREINDDYFQQVIGERLKNVIEMYFSKHHITVTARVFSILDEGKQPSSSDISFDELLELCDFNYYLLFLAVENRDCLTDDLIRSYLNEICTQEHISIGVYCFEYTSQSYLLCRKELIENPLISEAQMKKFKPICIDSFLIELEGGA